MATAGMRSAAEAARLLASVSCTANGACQKQRVRGDQRPQQLATASCSSRWSPQYEALEVELASGVQSVVARCGRWRRRAERRRWMKTSALRP